MHIHFHGAADTVTGSRHLVELAGTRVLLDCGMFQGFKVLRERNWLPPSPELLGADAVVLSHAHLDHSGWLPRLVRSGFRGPIYATPATRDLVEVMLLDSARLQEEDARRANRYAYTRHDKALPLYTTADAKRAIAKIVPLAPGRELALGRVHVSLTPVGHLLGACAVTLRAGHDTLVYSGDLGRDDDLLMPAPQRVAHADVLLVESTYGDRLHPRDDAMQRLGAIVRDTVGRGGSVLLPSFAVGRAQALLLVLQRLKASGQIPRRLPIYLDSPMAIEATELYQRHRRLLRVAAREIATLTDGVTLVARAAQSAKLAQRHYPAVIISASGMATGGRVVHHLKAFAPDRRNTILFAGYQAGGTRGAAILQGAASVRIHGEDVPIHAEVAALDSLSAHADAGEILQWLRGFDAPPTQTFITHGEPAAADAMRSRIEHELGWPCRVPDYLETVELA